MPSESNIKSTLYNYCLQYATDRIKRIQEEIKHQQAASNEETKSSAGDKYETGRAMAQQDIERNLVQLREAENLQTAVQRINLETETEVIKSGSLVTTSASVYYISIGLGPVKIEGKEYLLVAPASPIGKLLLGKRTGEAIAWRNEHFEILAVK
jgi:transcription elongation GreA/GreB family factor